MTTSLLSVGEAYPHVSGDAPPQHGQVGDEPGERLAQHVHVQVLGVHVGEVHDGEGTPGLFARRRGRGGGQARRRHGAYDRERHTVAKGARGYVPGEWGRCPVGYR